MFCHTCATSNSASNQINRIYRILLDKVVFQSLNNNTDGAINQNEFVAVTDDATAMTREELIVYSTSTGNVFYNENGVPLVVLGKEVSLLI